MIDETLRYGLDPALIIDSESTIAEAVAMMKEAGQDCVLVRGSSGSIDGIFTGRDLMRRLNLPGAQAAQWSTPVRLVMTFGVEMLHVSLIHLAPELMTSRGIRHVPIIEQEGSGPKRILGMLTMEGIFRSSVETERSFRNVHGLKRSPSRPRSIGIYAEDGALLSGLMGLLGADGKYAVHAIRRADLLLDERIRQVADSCDWIVFDVDGISLRRMAAVLRVLNRCETVRRVLLVCSPEKHGPSELELFRALQGVPKFEVRPKPIDSNDVAESLFRHEEAVA